MGNRSSVPRTCSSSFDDHSGYHHHHHHQCCTPLHHHAPSTLAPQRRLGRKFSRIDDNYQTLDQVTAALSRSGLESSNLIVGIDFTKSNEWTGAKSFNRNSLHHLGNVQNPYEQAITIIGKTLSSFDEDNLIPCFGFGDASTHDKHVFSFYPDGGFCEGFEEVLTRYRQLVPQLRLSGPTSFAPVIEMAMSIVEESRGQYHVLLIIADGQIFPECLKNAYPRVYLNSLAKNYLQGARLAFHVRVTRSNDTPNGQLSSQEKKTVEAIVKASEYPLSIILVGVGDGPWDIMQEFDDNIPARAFDNFQFVNFTDIMSKSIDYSRKEAEFALSALMEIPSQYLATIELDILGSHQTGNPPNRAALPPPSHGRVSSSGSSFKQYGSSSFPQSALFYPAYESPSSNIYDKKVCPICKSHSKDMAFGCGHQTCYDCGIGLVYCPICRSTITTRIKLYP